MSLPQPELAQQQPAAATLHLQLHQISVRFPVETASRGHVPAVCPRPDALETPGQERHVGPVKQTQLFRVTLGLLHSGVHTHNARSRSPKHVNTKKKEGEAPFPPRSCERL